MPKPFVERTAPERTFRHHLDAREDLRSDFVWRCGYCLTPEVLAEGQGFQVDHYHPSRGAAPNNDYDNLFWSCEVCNALKSGTTSETPYEPDKQAFMRVDCDQPRDHFTQQPSGHLNAKTQVGHFTASHLDFDDRTWLARLRKEIADLVGEQNAYARRFHDLEAFKLDRVPRPSRAQACALQQNLLNFAKRRKAGALLESDASAGVAHALERLVFESGALTEKVQRRHKHKTRRKRKR